jgi:hypothetical protein
VFFLWNKIPAINPIYRNIDDLLLTLDAISREILSMANFEVNGTELAKIMTNLADLYAWEMENLPFFQVINWSAYLFWIGSTFNES